MGSVAKFVWVALPALVGCGSLSQVSSQGAGPQSQTVAYPTSFPSSGVFEPDFERTGRWDGVEFKIPDPFEIPWGVSDSELNHRIDRVCVKVWQDVRFIRGENVDQLAVRIKAAADSILYESGRVPSKNEKDLIYYEATGAFIRASVKYGDSGFNVNVGSETQTHNKLLSMPVMRGTCGVFAGFHRLLSEKLGCVVMLEGGCGRSGEELLVPLEIPTGVALATWSKNHAWTSLYVNVKKRNGTIMPGYYQVWSDLTWVSLDADKPPSRKTAWHRVGVRTRAAAEVFFSEHIPIGLHQEYDTLFTMPFRGIKGKERTGRDFARMPLPEVYSLFERFLEYDKAVPLLHP